MDNIYDKEQLSDSKWRLPWWEESDPGLYKQI